MLSTLEVFSSLLPHDRYLMCLLSVCEILSFDRPDIDIRTVDSFAITTPGKRDTCASSCAMKLHAAARCNFRSIVSCETFDWFIILPPRLALRIA